MKKHITLILLLFLLAFTCASSYAEGPPEYCPHCSFLEWNPVEVHEDPTCITKGYTGYQCSLCGWIYETSVFSPFGHNFTGSNPRVCCNAGCNESNPAALTGFSFSVETNLCTYPAPSVTTLIPVAAPNTATGYINYSVDPAGIVGLGAENKSSLTGASLNTPVYIQAIKAGETVLSLYIYDGCGFYQTIQRTITVTGKTATNPSSIEVYPKSATVESGKTATISATVLPAQADQTVSWYSDNTTVATVVNGVITGIGPGYATVTVASTVDRTVSTPITVYVPDIKITSISFPSKTVVLNAGSSTTINYEILPANAVNKTLTWESSNPAVAYVDSKGCIYGLKEGVSVITACSSDKTVSETCAVTVMSSISPTYSPSPIYTTYYSPGYYSTGNNYEDTNYAGYLMYFNGPLYTRTGYTQTGWSLDYYGRTLDFNFYKSYSNESDLNLYPYWTANSGKALKLTINYDSSLGTVYFNGKIFPSGHYWSIREGETLNFSFSPIQNYYASYIKLSGRYLSIYNNSFSVSYSDMQASDQTAYVSFVSKYSRPKTGDDSMSGFWLTLCTSSAVMFTCIAVRRQKKY